MTKSQLDERLYQFESQEEFSKYADSLFDLSDTEKKGLYRVLIKLQSIGEDPKKIMRYWKKRTCEKDCGDFIRFMIMVDEMDMDELKNATAVYEF